MKRILCLLFAALLLTGCKSQAESGSASGTYEQTNSGISRSIQSVLADAPAEFARLQEKTVYNNLNFDCADLSLPTAEGDLYALNLTRTKLSQDRYADLFLQTLSKTFSEDTAADHDNLFFGSEAVPPEFNDFTLAYPRIYDGNYESKIRSGGLDCYVLLYQTDTERAHESDRYFMLSADGGIKMNRGTCTRSIEMNRALAGWMPRDNYEVRKWYTPDSEDSFQLSNGKSRICDAAAYCQQYLSSDVFPEEMRTAKWQTKTVGIMNTDSEHHAFYFLLTREYGGIPFDSLHTEGAFSDFSDGNEYLFDGSEALMMESGEIEYYYLMNTADKIIPAEQPASNVISLQAAAKAVSGTLTKAFAFDVQDISLVYCNKKISETESEARAHWRFVLRNPNDERTYVVYVDAETGDSFYYAY